jgi:hypothetical protein
MSESAKGKLRAWIGQAAVALVALYPLSIGPAAWITARLGCSWTIFDDVYAPLWRLCEFAHTSDALRWYMELWVNFIHL